MKKAWFRLIFLTGVLGFSGQNVQAQIWKDIIERVPNVGSKGADVKSGSLNSSEVVAGLKEALSTGARQATNILSEKDGFFGNNAVKILLPEEARSVERTLRSMGFGNLVDETILSMNRAAEDAAIKAAPIFVSAISQMTIEDGWSILNGGDGAATRYLRSTTTTELKNAFTPVIEQSLAKLNVEKYWTDVFSTYNQIPFIQKKVDPDLTAYVAQKTLDGLFFMIEKEENQIRKDPAARVSDLLKKVFGGK